MPRVVYEKDGRIARVTLNRPDAMNAIDMELPGELAAAIEKANADPKVHVIVLAGAGKAFCAGYDLSLFAEAGGSNPGVQEMPWDPMKDYQLMMGFTEKFMAIFRSFRPVICKVHGFAVAGGSDIALCSDFVIMSEDAQIGYMPARVWGCPTTAMWVYRLGMERAKRMLLTGDKVGAARPRAEGGAGRGTRPRGRSVRGAHGVGAGEPTHDAEAHDQPGLRKHGPQDDADVSDDIRWHHSPLAGRHGLQAAGGSGRLEAGGARAGPRYLRLDHGQAD